MANIGSISVNLVARTGRFVKKMRAARSSVMKFGDRVKVVQPQLARFATTMLGFVTAGAAISGLKRAVTSIDKLAKTSTKLGITTEALSGLHFAAKRTGVEANTLDMALQRMTRRLSEAAMGGGEALGAIRELGLDAKVLAGLSPDKAFIRIAEAMSRVKNQGDRVRLTFKFLDSEGVAALNTMELGADGLKKYAREAGMLGAIVSSQTSKDLAELMDTVTRLGAAFQGMFIKAAEGAAVLGRVLEFFKVPEIIAGIAKMGENLGAEVSSLFYNPNLKPSLAPGLGGSANQSAPNNDPLLAALGRIEANTAKDKATRP